MAIAIIKQQQQREQRRGRVLKHGSTTTVLVLTNIISFLIGLKFNQFVVLYADYDNNIRTASSLSNIDCTLSSFFEQQSLQQTTQRQQGARRMGGIEVTEDDRRKSHVLLPPDRVGNYLVGMSRIPKWSFLKLFQNQIGFPHKGSLDGEYGEQDVLMIYGTQESVPSRHNDSNNTYNDNNNVYKTTIPLIQNAKDATNNCDQINIVLSNTKTLHRQCVAILPQYESFYVQKLIRSDTTATTNNPDIDSTTTSSFRYVSKFHRVDDANSVINKPPSIDSIRKHWHGLNKFITNIDTVLSELRIVLQSMNLDTTTTNNTVIVMVCNYGQSILLQNFFCSALSRGHNLSNVIIFATDIETFNLVTSYNVTAYYDHGLFGEHPNKAAELFGDENFVIMVTAKIRCAVLISMLGYNFLFQDVDIVWLNQESSPLQYFLTQEQDPNDQYDIYFQEDGARTILLNPYFANSGFYYVKNNIRSQRFFISLLMSGDSIIENSNNQILFNVILNEHAVLYGLKIKIFPRDVLLFPGGYHYHQNEPNDKDVMKQIMNGTSKSYIFHMSWTESLMFKIKFLQQMGQWYVSENCATSSSLYQQQNQPRLLTKTDQEIVHTNNGCCAVAPKLHCHYRDKPSSIPCPNSEAMDQGAASWW